MLKTVNRFMRLRVKFGVPFVTEIEKIEYDKMEKAIR
jgi:hypothetical protein